MYWVYQSAVAQRDALRRRDISAVELLQLTIEHAENLKPYLNPIALPLYDYAQAAAEKTDQALASGNGGPLCGIPVTIKDSQWLAGFRCANGSWSLAEHVPATSSQAVEALEAAGAVIFAKTTCPEFSLNGITASSFYGQTSNPWNTSLTCGGSSGGAGVAVATGMGALSLGGDGGGSIRIPSAFCGITGFKPTHGVVKRSPGFKTWSLLVSYGPMTRSVADAELMFNALTKQETPQKTESEPLKLIVSPDLGFAPVDPDIANAFQNTLSLLADSGMTLVHDNPGLPSSGQTWAIIAAYDMWSKKGQNLSASDFGLLGATAQEFLEFGQQFSEQDYLNAQLDIETIEQAYRALFERHNCQLLVTPTMGCEPFPHGQTHPAMIADTLIDYPWLDWAGFQYDANLIGAPAISIPFGVSKRGLPMGMQILSLPGNDHLVLKAAKQIEKLLGWQQPHFNPSHYQQTVPVPESEEQVVAF